MIIQHRKSQHKHTAFQNCQQTAPEFQTKQTKPTVSRRLGQTCSTCDWFNA
ncbi:hypothetical protein X975_20586, partial [Stegodyphus mimosarum]